MVIFHSYVSLPEGLTSGKMVIEWWWSWWFVGKNGVVSWDGYHEIHGDLMVIYPLVNIEKTIENGDLVVDFPMKNGTIFHSYVNVYQRVWEKGSVLLQVRLPNHTLLGQLGLASFWPPTRKNSSKFHLRLAGSIELDAEQGMCESLTPDLPPKKFKQLCRFSQKSHGCLECFKWLWVKIKSCW
jgi:hypothetical protein